MKLYTVQCTECLRVLGVSIKNFQGEEIFCMDCSKERFNKDVANE